MTKLFMSYDHLIDFLKNSKNLIINNEENAKSILAKTSYFSLISGYKDIFKNPTTGKYRDGTYFEDIYSLYRFDVELRSLFLKYILVAERSIKSSLAYHFAEKYGESQQEYMNILNYDCNTKNENNIRRLLDILSFQLKGKSDYAYINHYKEKHNNVPIWIMVQVLTLGQVSHMFDYLKATVPIRMCNDFHGIARKEMHSFLSVMTKHRNACAHGERLFNYVTKDSITDSLIHRKLQIPQQNGRYIYGKEDLFSEIIILKYLLDVEDFSAFYYELECYIEKFRPNRRIMEIMGFPSNWSEIFHI